MKRRKKSIFIIVLIAFMQVFVFSACKQKVAAKDVSTNNIKSKKVAVCCRSNIPPRFGMPKVQLEKTENK